MTTSTMLLLAQLAASMPLWQPVLRTTTGNIPRSVFCRRTGKKRWKLNRQHRGG